MNAGSMKGRKYSVSGSLLMLSQNHRMLGVRRDLCGSPSPTPCPSRVTQSRLHSTLSRRVWNISREGDSTTSLGNLFQGSIILKGKFFLIFRWNFPCFSLCPLPLVLSLGTTEKSHSVIILPAQRMTWMLLPLLSLYYAGIHHWFEVKQRIFSRTDSIREKSFVSDHTTGPEVVRYLFGLCLLSICDCAQVSSSLCAQDPYLQEGGNLSSCLFGSYDFR